MFLCGWGVATPRARGKRPLVLPTGVSATDSTPPPRPPPPPRLVDTAAPSVLRCVSTTVRTTCLSPPALKCHPAPFFHAHSKVPPRRQPAPDMVTRCVLALGSRGGVHRARRPAPLGTLRAHVARLARFFPDEANHHERLVSGKMRKRGPQNRRLATCFDPLEDRSFSACVAYVAPAPCSYSDRYARISCAGPAAGADKVGAARNSRRVRNGSLRAPETPESAMLVELRDVAARLANATPSRCDVCCFR